MSAFAEERNKAFTDAVVNDNWDGVRAFMEKYRMSASSDTVMKAGIYKAVQYCTNIPEDVKILAIEKCVKMGFSPFIKPIGEWRESE